MRWVARGAGWALIALVLAFDASTSDSAAETMTAIKLDKGRRETRTVRAGDTIEIKLPAIPSTGYSWQVEGADPKVLSVVNKRFESRSDDAPRVGATVDQVITLKAVGDGKTEVRLVYRRPWEQPAAGDDTAVLNVTVGKP